LLNPDKKNGRLDPTAVYADAGVVAVAAPKVAGASARGKVMEKVIADAIMQALAEGISINSPIIKERILAARRAAGGG
jgi:hypothetical protein